MDYAVEFKKFLDNPRVQVVFNDLRKFFKLDYPKPEEGEECGRLRRSTQDPRHIQK